VNFRLCLLPPFTLVALITSAVADEWVSFGQQYSAIPSEISSCSTWDEISITGGDNYSIAIKNGLVITWGHPHSNARVVPPEASFVKQVSSGFFNVAALTYSGSVIVWGSDTYGEKNVPNAAKSGVAAISSLSGHVAALKEDGSVILWGAQSFVPIEARSGVVAIAAGGGHTLALKQGGALIGWGSNDSGQAAVPTAALTDVKAIAAGGRHSVALKKDGSVIVWGDNSYKQRNVPAEALSGVIAIAAGADHTIALKQNGTAIAWGSNIFGQARVPDTSQRVAISIATTDYASFFRLAPRPPDARALFRDWATSQGLSGQDAEPSATPYNDGIPNFLKFAFNMNAFLGGASNLKSGTGISGLPLFSITETGNTRTFQVEYIRRKDGSMDYTPKASVSLEPSSFFNMSYEELITPIDSTWERVVAKYPYAQYAPRMFGIVEVKVKY
jgi:hypothetical protein